MLERLAPLVECNNDRKSKLAILENGLAGDFCTPIEYKKKEKKKKSLKMKKKKKKRKKEKSIEYPGRAWHYQTTKSIIWCASAVASIHRASSTGTDPDIKDQGHKISIDDTFAPYSVPLIFKCACTKITQLGTSKRKQDSRRPRNSSCHYSCAPLTYIGHEVTDGANPRRISCLRHPSR